MLRLLTLGATMLNRMQVLPGRTIQRWLIRSCAVFVAIALSLMVPEPAGASSGAHERHPSEVATIGFPVAGATAAAPGDGSAKVDTYNAVGTTVKPCARSVGAESVVTYTCRDGWAIGPNVIYWYTWDSYTIVDEGTISGGRSYVDVKGGRIYEGCRSYYGTGGAETNYDICDQIAINPVSSQYKQSGPAYYAMAASNWGHDTATAWSCVYAMYQSDPYELSTNCT